jgi:signal transduction histidine kinase
MKRVVLRLWPRSLAAQLVVLLLGAVIVAHVVLGLLLAEERHDALLSERRGGALVRVAAISRILAATPRDNWNDVLRVAQSPQLHLRLSDKPRMFGAENDVSDLLTQRLNAALDNPPVRASVGFLSENDCRHEREKEHRRLKRSDDGQDEKSDHHKHKRFFDNIECGGPPVMGLAVPIFSGIVASSNGGGNNPASDTVGADGMQEAALHPSVWLDAQVNGYAPPPWLWLKGLGRVVLSAVLIGIIAFFIARRITRPWKELAAAADRIGRGDFPDPVPERGPTEIEHAARAFNRMSARLKRFVVDRTRMLAAISHDLRTPITSLRLRAEFVDDPENRRKIIETLDEMEQMVDAAMTFAREETANEKTRKIDMVALVEATCTDLEEVGHPVTFESALDHYPYACRPLSVKRALSNLLTNGLSYGTNVAVSVARADDGGLWIDVCDDGPGIPVDQRDKVFEPFVRLEESRNRETGGIGLGLAIARTAIRAHGGEIYLEDAPQGGLCARIYLPSPLHP